jgi:hypothetical protein
MKKSKRSVIDKFIALPDSEKDKIVQRLESESPEHQLARSRPLNARERKQWQRFKSKSKIGRPRIGKGAQTISLTVERNLLKQADSYAKQHGLTRSKLIAQGLLAILNSAA